jgi:hypothetical protein
MKTAKIINERWFRGLYTAQERMAYLAEISKEAALEVVAAEPEMEKWLPENAEETSRRLNS